MLPVLQTDWQDVAAAAMRNANLLVHDRANFQLRVARKIGTNNARLEFTS
jgi:hypothetical protein